MKNKGILLKRIILVLVIFYAMITFINQQKVLNNYNAQINSLKIDIAEAQNYFFSKIVNNIEEMIQNMTCSADRELVTMLFEIGENLNINMDYYKQQFNKALVRGKG